MNNTIQTKRKSTRCAIYTRKSTEEGLEQEFNSLDAQREACEAYIHSQRHEGWQFHSQAYDDGGYSGGNIDRPALTHLMDDLKAGIIDIVVVYKIDRLSRSLSDFVRIVELFDKQNVSFVSVTQQFNTSTSMGRLTLNVLLSFAQFEREVTGERIRDKIAASVRKGMWMGGTIPLGYDALDKKLVINKTEADTVRHIYTRYLALKCVRKLKADLDVDGFVSKLRITKSGQCGGTPFMRGALYTVLKNSLYIGKVRHHKNIYEGQQEAIVKIATWKQVQQQLEENRNNHKRRAHAKEPAPLAGLIYDDQGNIMSPSHGNKNQNRRYRYYVSQATLRYLDREAGSVTRIAAHAIENLVTQELRALLQDGSRLLDISLPMSLSLPQQSAILEQGKRISNQWGNQLPLQKKEILIATLKKVTVGRKEVTLIFSTAGLLTLLGLNYDPETVESDNYVIDLNVSLQRCGIESKLIVQGKDPGTAHKRTVLAIQQALHKAVQWNNELVSGSSSSMSELAKRHGVTQRYIAHLIKLAWLSPEIMQTIVNGQVPSTLSLDQLKKGFPIEWDLQRQALGFPT